MKRALHGVGSSLAIVLVLGACRQTRPQPCPPPAATAPPNSGMSLIGAPSEPAPDATDPAEYRRTVGRTIASHLDDIRTCYAKGQIQSPQLSGVVGIAGTVTGSGSVAGARVEKSTLRANVGNGPKIVEACVVERFASWSFPPPPPGASDQIDWSFSFDAPPHDAGADAAVAAWQPTLGGNVAAEYRKTVNRTIASHGSETQACYAKAQIQSPRLSGTVSISGTVTPSGSVAGPSVTSDLRAAGGNGPTILETCMRDRFASWTFPPPPPGASDHITYRFKFE